MTKAEELINKHLTLEGGSDLAITDGRIYNAFLNALNEAINDTHCCTELPNEQDETEYWVDLVNWEGGGIEEVSNTNLIVFKKEIDLEIQRRLKK